jgi:hypothetical protein
VFDIEQNGHAANNWEPVQVVTSDATGNRLTGWINNFGQGTSDGAIYQFGLWPDEPVWKVRFEFSRKSGFADSELWTVQNVPVQPGQMQDFWNYSRNRARLPFAEADVNGFHLKMYSAIQFTNQPNGSGQIEGGLVIQANAAPAGMRMTLVKVTDDQGREISPMSWGSGGTDFRFGLQNLGDVKTLNLTLALHKSRFVEFAVKPQTAGSTNSP